MKHQQTGEIMIAMMAVMLVIMLLSSHHLTMMSHGGDHSQMHGQAVQPENARPAAAPPPQVLDARQDSQK